MKRRMRTAQGQAVVLVLKDGRSFEGKLGLGATWTEDSTQNEAFGLQRRDEEPVPVLFDDVAEIRFQ
jgi:hypothetical protein